MQSEIEALVAREEPDVEVLLAEVVGGNTVRVFIDHPDGVTIALCERVSRVLTPMRDRYAIEVSSPGDERPLTKPAHFRRFVGRRARVRTRPAHEECEGFAKVSEQARRRSFIGELVGATDEEVTLAADEGVIAIPYSQIRKSNLLGE